MHKQVSTGTVCQAHRHGNETHRVTHSLLAGEGIAVDERGAVSLTFRDGRSVQVTPSSTSTRTHGASICGSSPVSWFLTAA